MEFRVLGPFEVIDGDRTIALSAPRQRALLAALVLRAGEALSPETLAETVWGTSPPASAASVLRLYVSQIRRALPPGRIVTRRPGYALVASAGELDAARFEELLADGRRTLADGNPRLAASLLARALGLWRGEALADLTAEGLVLEEAARLDELRVACLEERLQADLLLGRHAEVLAELVRLVGEHPLREGLRAQLMLALYRAGRQADALACYRDGRRLLVADLGLEPGAELRELEQRILRHDPSLELTAPEPPSAPVAVLPRPPSETIGRERELSEIRRRLLSPTTRLLTLVGPGGIGKTRLALETAADLDGELTDGAVLVELAALRDPEQLLPTVGHALGLRESGTRSWPEQLAGELRPRELLLVLDNLEHLLGGVEPLAGLLAVAPRLTVLATSRTPLRLAAEEVLDVPPLEPAAAAALLVERTIAAGASATALAANGETIDRLCERLDRTPLAIELAAPWLRTLTPPELLVLLDSRLDTLQGGRRDMPARHRTLRSTIDWSFDLLDEAERHLVARLSVFVGGFTLEAMLDVAEPEATVARLASLVDASIVHVRDGRYGLLEVVREYAAERLGPDPQTHDRHAAHFLRVAQAAEQHLTGPDQASWLQRLDAEHDNLRAALDWFAGENDAGGELRLAAALGRFWYVRGHVGEGLARLQHAVARASGDDAATLANALRSASALAVIQGDYVLARRLAERSLELYRELADLVGVTRSLSNLGAILHAQGELDLAAATLDECIRDCVEVGDERLAALAHNNRGDVALSQRDLETAAAQFERSLAILRDLGDSANIARSLYNLGATAVEQGRHEHARVLLQEGIELSDRLGDSEDVAWCLIGLAAVAAETGRPADAARMLGFAAALLERIGATMKPFEQTLHDRTFVSLQTALGGPGFERTLAEGAALQLAEAVRRALALTQE